MTGTTNPPTERPDRRIARVGTVAVATLAAVVAAGAITMGAVGAGAPSTSRDDPRQVLFQELDTMERDARSSLTEAQQEQDALDEAEREETRQDLLEELSTMEREARMRE